MATRSADHQTAGADEGSGPSRDGDEGETAAALERRYRATRALSEALVAPLSDADATIQSMEDASPAKWHLAHTSWFFETFVLRDHVPGYRLFDERWPYLFNSYYEAEGARHARARRGMLSRPSLAEILRFRRHVDQAMAPLLRREECAGLIALGIAHEQQHIELLLTDIKHALFQNPLGPAMFEGAAAGNEGAAPDRAPVPASEAAAQWWRHDGGLVEIGHPGRGFAFDNEGPRHKRWLEPFEIASALVTNRDWDQFIADGGYRDPRLWLAEGWAMVERDAIRAPLYWRDHEHEGPQYFTHAGWQRRDPDAPVTHISFYEADAFARWAGARLPTEFEWEALALALGQSGAGGNQLDSALAPMPRPQGALGALFGDCWQWTASSYQAYPSYRPAEGAIGEYNGKFMSAQMVLRGASCASVRGHARPSYRNFFYPHQRWQFAGLRLARDLGPGPTPRI